MAQAGPQGKPLFGVPFAVKDNIDVAGLPTTAACPAFAYKPQRSAFVVERLVAAGAIPIGKTNLDQFATGLVGVRSPYGVPRNALRADLIPGGSSSGSAAAVGAGLVPFALGTDTAGSGRVPAAINGIVGLKPTLGALSASGVVPACRTLDTISIFALDVADAFAAFAVAQGYDAADAYSRAACPRPRSRAAAGPSHRRSRAGWSSSATPRPRPPSPAIVAALARLGFEIVGFDFAPFAEVARLLYEGPWVAERYAATKPLIETDPEALHPVTRAIIEGARKFDAVSAFEAFYKLAALKRATSAAWRDFDVMLVPTLPRLYTVEEVAGRSGAAQFATGNLHQFRQPARSRRHRRSRRDARRRPAVEPDVHRAGRRGRDAGGARGRRAGALRRADGRDGPHAAARPALAAAPERIELVVVGAHLTGLPLNRELTELGARFVREVETTRRLPLLRAAGDEARQARPAARRRWRRRRDQGRDLVARRGRLRRLRRRDSPAARDRNAAARRRRRGQGLSGRGAGDARRRGHHGARGMAGLSGARITLRTTRPPATGS